MSKKNCIVSGNLRSFNDSVFNAQTIINLKNFNKIKHFDTKKGIINFSKNSMLNKKTAYKNRNYFKFKKKINSFNSDKKFNSFFSQRLGIS